jgi:ribosomal protein S27E
MRRYEYSESDQDGWKSYPIRVTTSRVSRCHNKPEVLVQSMEGGFVTANCTQCGNSDTLPHDEFKKLAIYVACPECRKEMVATLLRSTNNYGYECEPCSEYLRLADLLPHWKDAT